MTRYRTLKGFLVILAFTVAFQVNVARNGISLEPNTAHADIACSQCQWIVATCAGYLTPQSTEKELEAILEKVCPLAPQHLQHSCLVFATTYKTQLIQLLLRGTPPNSICPSLGVCKQ